MFKEFLNICRNIFNEKYLILILHQYYNTYVMLENRENNKIQKLDIINNDLIDIIDIGGYNLLVNYQTLLVYKNKVIHLINLIDGTKLTNTFNYKITSIHTKNNMIAIKHENVVDFINLNFEFMKKSFNLLSLINLHNLDMMFIIGQRLIIFNASVIYSVNLDDHFDIQHIQVDTIDYDNFITTDKHLITVMSRSIIIYESNLLEKRLLLTNIDFPVCLYNVQFDKLFCKINNKIHIIDISSSKILNILEFNKRIMDIVFVFDLIVVSIPLDYITVLSINGEFNDIISKHIIGYKLMNVD